MRIPEWIQIAMVSMLLIVALLRRIHRRRQLRVALLALLALTVVLGSNLSRHLFGGNAASIISDWLPGALILIPYWQVGQFFTEPDQVMEARLSAFDDDLFQWLRIRPAESRIPRLVAAYLELAYFLVYPLVPLGVVVLYTTGLRSKVDFYWTIVLVATYISYACTLGIRARPPRMLLGHVKFPTPRTEMKMVNRKILDRASIQAITCPSAHVASAMASALVILHFQASIELLFVWAALSIATATIVGGYHYVVDVLSAALLAILVFAIICFMR